MIPWNSVQTDVRELLTLPCGLCPYQSMILTELSVPYGQIRDVFFWVPLLKESMIHCTGLEQRGFKDRQVIARQLERY